MAPFLNKMDFLYVALGGALGALSRYSLGLLLKVLPVKNFPAATFTVNIMGCFLIGLLYGLFLRKWLPESVRPFLLTGFLGAFTTFSSFILEAVELSGRSLILSSVLYLFFSIAGGILFFICGSFLSSKLGLILNTNS